MNAQEYSPGQNSEEVKSNWQKSKNEAKLDKTGKLIPVCA